MIGVIFKSRFGGLKSRVRENIVYAHRAAPQLRCLGRSSVQAPGPICFHFCSKILGLSSGTEFEKPIFFKRLGGPDRVGLSLAREESLHLTGWVPVPHPRSSPNFRPFTSSALAWHMRAQPGASSSLERHGCNICLLYTSPSPRD